MDANILKQYIFQKGFITESAKLKREQEAASSTLQVCKEYHHVIRSRQDGVLLLHPLPSLQWFPASFAALPWHDADTIKVPTHLTLMYSISCLLS